MQNSASPPPYKPSDSQPRVRSDSHVRIRPSATGFAAIARGQLGPTRREPQVRGRSCLEELAVEQTALTRSLRGASEIIGTIPRDPSAHAAAQSMRDRLADLGELKAALDAVYLDATDPRMHEMLGRDSALTEYLRGLYTWCKGVLRAFEELASGLRVLTPDWALLRARLDDARAFYLDELEGLLHGELARLRLHSNGPASGTGDPLSDLDAHLAELFWAAAYLATSLEKRFG